MFPSCSGVHRSNCRIVVEESVQLTTNWIKTEHCKLTTALLPRLVDGDKQCSLQYRCSQYVQLHHFLWLEQMLFNSTFTLHKKDSVDLGVLNYIKEHSNMAPCVFAVKVDMFRFGYVWCLKKHSKPCCQQCAKVKMMPLTVWTNHVFVDMFGLLILKSDPSCFAPAW